jgi:molybdenum cofactor biosynthesis protein B
MPKIDESRPFLPVNIAVLTVSDTRTAADDKSGNTLAEMIVRDGHHVAARRIVKDDQESIVAALRAWIADPDIDAVITTGGTGVTGRDVTPEAIEPLLEKRIDGFGEIAFRMAQLCRRSAPRRSRAARPPASPARTYVFGLPGSPSRLPRRLGRASLKCPARQPASKPCNLVELMPRLHEHLHREAEGDRLSLSRSAASSTSSSIRASDTRRWPSRPTVSPRACDVDQRTPSSKPIGGGVPRQPINQ